MSHTVIQIENISKRYRLGQIGSGSLSEDLNSMWANIRGKEDPHSKINDSIDKDKKEHWALTDVSFNVKQGEAIGIVGKNGAGKSTLLKILSRVTSPTTGTVKVKGRIASLLEVGTGFHPDLTGRENIYLNAAILGMTRTEVNRKFDEIVEFSGVEKYIHTPVKRYSSGMYVRLAFAVAAHLESEILVVDEVLAVGDSEFQKKCLGKMKDVTGDGRTVLFVSHNMTAVNTLCSSAVYLKNGRVFSLGASNEIVNQYLSNENQSKTSVSWEVNNRPGDDVAKVDWARLVNKRREKVEFALIDEQIGVEFQYEILKDGYFPIPNIHVTTAKGEFAFVSGEEKNEKLKGRGVYNTVMWVPENLLNEGTYLIRLAISTMSSATVHCSVMEAIVFEAIEDENKRGTDIRGNMPGVVRPFLKWDTLKIK